MSCEVISNGDYLMKVGEIFEEDISSPSFCACPECEKQDIVKFSKQILISFDTYISCATQ